MDKFVEMYLEPCSKIYMNKYSTLGFGCEMTDKMRIDFLDNAFKIDMTCEDLRDMVQEKMKSVDVLFLKRDLFDWRVTYHIVIGSHRFRLAYIKYFLDIINMYNGDETEVIEFYVSEWIFFIKVNYEWCFIAGG